MLKLCYGKPAYSLSTAGEALLIYPEEASFPRTLPATFQIDILNSLINVSSLRLVAEILLLKAVNFSIALIVTVHSLHFSVTNMTVCKILCRLKNTLRSQRANAV